MITGHIVSPMSIKDIETWAHRLRSFLEIKDSYIDITSVYDKLAILNLIDYQLVEDYDFISTHCAGDTSVEAYVSPSNKAIYIKESVFSGAIDGKPRMRFTLAHELAHAIFHINQPVLKRYTNDSRQQIFRDSEWQANCFAGCLLAPSYLLSDKMSIEHIAQEFGISKAAAEVRRDQFLKNKK